MHTNRINNKNTKRFAIATSATAAVLFLGAGLVASCGGKSNNTKAVDAPLAVVPAPIVDEVSEIVEAPLTAAPLTEASAPQKDSTQSKSPVKSPKTKKSPVKSPKTKKSPAVSGDAGAKQSAATPNTSASPAPQQDNNTAVAAPAGQPAVNQQPAASDAVATAPADAQPATSQEAAPAQQPAAQEQSTATSSGSSVRVPLWTINGTAQNQRIKTPPTVSIPCIPNLTC